MIFFIVSVVFPVNNLDIFTKYSASTVGRSSDVTIRNGTLLQYYFVKKKKKPLLHLF